MSYRPKQKPPPDRYTVEDPETARQSRELREAFAQARQAVYQNALQPGRAWTRLESKIIAAWRASGLTPVEFCYRQVQHALAHQIELFPQCLLVQVGEQDRHALNLKDLSSYRAMLAILDTRIMLLGPRLAIMDDQTQVTPLPRYVYAEKYGFADIADRLRDAASIEMSSRPIAYQLFSDAARKLSRV